VDALSRAALARRCTVQAHLPQNTLFDFKLTLPVSDGVRRAWKSGKGEVEMMYHSVSSRQA
jgi:hypothetical protein